LSVLVAGQRLKPEEDRDLLEDTRSGDSIITGMERSSTMTSGFSCWAFAIASRPFSASPQISQSFSWNKRRKL
jgi:hypothetical protein